MVRKFYQSACLSVFSTTDSHYSHLLLVLRGDICRRIPRTADDVSLIPLQLPGQAHLLNIKNSLDVNVEFHPVSGMAGNGLFSFSSSA